MTRGYPPTSSSPTLPGPRNGQLLVAAGVQARKFDFGADFNAPRVVAPPEPKRVFTAEEVEAARAEGLAEGRRAAGALAETQAAAALADITRAVRQAMGALSDVAHGHKADAARLALACGRAIADAALDAFPTAPLEAAISALAREVEAQPRLIVRTTPAHLDHVQAAMARAAEAAGFAGQVTVRADPALTPAAFSLDWGEGRAAFDPAEAAVRVQAACEAALAAERLHAPPLAIDPEADIP